MHSNTQGRELMFNSEKLGKLYLDKEFISGAGMPTLFTCRSTNRKNLYLCQFCKNSPRHKKWLIALITPDKVVEMLEDKISLRECMKSGKKSERYNLDWWGTTDNFGKWEESNNPDEWTSEYPPDEGEYMDADPNEFLDTIEYYRNCEA